MRNAMIAVLSVALFSPFMVGCDQPVASSHDEGKNLMGTPQTTDSTTYKRSDGTTYTDTSKQTAPNH